MRPDGSNAFSDEYSENYNSQNELYGRFETGLIGQNLVLGGEFARYQFKYIFNQRSIAPIDRLNPVYGALPGVPLFSFNDDSASNQVGLYVQDQIELTRKLRVMVGGRFSSLPSRTHNLVTGVLKNEQTDRDFLPRAAVSYQVSSSGNAYSVTRTRSSATSLRGSEVASGSRPCWSVSMRLAGNRRWPVSASLPPLPCSI